MTHAVFTTPCYCLQVVRWWPLNRVFVLQYFLSRVVDGENDGEEHSDHEFLSQSERGHMSLEEAVDSFPMPFSCATSMGVDQY